MSSIKKLMCNPPAQAVANHGDYYLAGMFVGAGEAIHYLAETGEHPEARAEFTHNVLEIELSYVEKRLALESEYRAHMQAQFDWLAAKVDEPANLGELGGHKEGNERDKDFDPDQDLAQFGV